MRVLVAVNLKTIEQGKSELLLLEARDSLENENCIEINSINKRINEIEEFLLL